MFEPQGEKIMETIKIYKWEYLDNKEISNLRICYLTGNSAILLKSLDYKPVIDIYTKQHTVEKVISILKEYGINVEFV